MELRALFLLTATILVQGQGKSNDPNDEPFLPIYPVYPYSPKLIKRGTEKETVAQLSPELYAPKVDAKDSYSASYSANSPRDPYYPNYNPYPKVSTAPTYSYYNSLPYSYPTTPYNPYTSYSSPYTAPSPPYEAIPYSSYPNYYYQQPYYYHPSYYNQPLLPSPLLPPPDTDYPSDPYTDPDSNGKNKEKKTDGDKGYKDNNVNQDSAGNQFVDGANYISGNPKDLDSQSSSYKTSSPQNQLEQGSNVQIKNLPIPVPRTTYRVISVAGQPVGPDYPLPATYAKAQHLEELMSQTWARMMAQNLQQQATQYPEASKNVAARANGGQYANQNDKEPQRFLSIPNVIAKSGLAFIVNPNILGRLNVGPPVGQLIQTSAPLRNIRYPSVAPGVYTAIEKPERDQAESSGYENYDNSSSQSTRDYDSSSSQVDKQNYENDSGQSVSYQNQNFVTAETPSRYNYQHSNYNPSQAIAQQSQQYKNNLDDGSFGVKTSNG